MKNAHFLYFLAATLFAIAAVLSFINGSVFRGLVGVIGAISFVLGGIHWLKRNR